MSLIMEIKKSNLGNYRTDDNNLSEYIDIEEEIPDIQKKNITKNILF